jgi:hypothetical protein
VKVLLWDAVVAAHMSLSLVPKVLDANAVSIGFILS